MNEHEDRIKKALNFVQSNRRALQYILAKNFQDQHRFGQVPLSQPILQNIQDILEDQIRSICDEVADGKPIKEFSIANCNEEPTPVQYLPIDELPTGANIEYLLTDPRLDEKSYEEWPNPDLQIIRVKEPGGSPVLGIQEFTKRQIVGSSKPFIFARGEEQYDIVEDKLRTVPKRINAIYYDSYIYVFNPKAFERMYDVEEQYRKEADEVFEELLDCNIALNDQSILDTMKNDIRCLRRIHEIKRHQVNEDISPAKVERVINKYDVPVDYSYNGDKITLSIDDGRKRWKLRDLLSDSYLQSEMTDNQYNASNKERVD